MSYSPAASLRADTSPSVRGDDSPAASLRADGSPHRDDLHYSPAATLREALSTRVQSDIVQAASDVLTVAPQLRGALISFLATAAKSMQRDQDPVARHIEVGGTADSVGAATLALGDNVVSLKDLGAVTVATGAASYLAAAHSPVGETTQAFADAFTDYDGFDFVFQYTVAGSGAGHNAAAAGDDLQWAGARTCVFALDIEGYEFGDPPNIRDGNWRGHKGDWTFENHVAEVQANADVWGVNALALTSTDAFTSSSFSHAAGSAYALLE